MTNPKQNVELSPMDLYHTRLLVFLEESPQSNKYLQVFLTPEEFKKFSDTIGRATGKKLADGTDEVEIVLSEETYDLPDLQETHDK